MAISLALKAAASKVLDPFRHMTRPSVFSDPIHSLSSMLNNPASSRGMASGATNFFPKRTKFNKQHRGRMKGIAHKGNSICFGSYALQVREASWITARQIEAGRRAMSRNIGRGAKIWVRVFPDKPVTVRPTETRMGRGKGNTAYWVAVVQPGRILYEIGGVAENVARKAIQIAGSKMPIQTQFILQK
uniref:50S ribosomal protein L16, chloroplastic n=1 Tax=Kalanchoe fedtschenkoi TaxID=63787 RepID=A0A7N0TZL2_KALFE